MSIRIEKEPLLALLGEHGERWLKGEWDDGAGNYCFHGAIRKCQPLPGDAYLVQQVADLRGWGTEWNDEASTSWSDIRERINDGIEVTDQDLADTYGPQWREIVALVRRAAALTPGEAHRLRMACVMGGVAAAAAWAAEWAAAAAEWAAAAAKAQAAANAANEASRAPTVGGVGVAAIDAARALAVRHLIGDHFTQEHYDLLTRPWREVIGPVHPEDPPLKEMLS